LRPAALLEAELGDLLRQLIEAIMGRTRLPITLTIEGQRGLPPEAQIALYRIAQEALNNVIKHAGAHTATVSLCLTQDAVDLRISDDGRGFDPGYAGSGRLGLRGMRERAQAIAPRCVWRAISARAPWCAQCGVAVPGVSRASQAIRRSKPRVGERGSRIHWPRRPTRNRAARQRV
jgi:signal transduction histidine kinase